MEASRCGVCGTLNYGSCVSCSRLYWMMSQERNSSREQLGPSKRSRDEVNSINRTRPNRPLERVRSSTNALNREQQADYFEEFFNREFAKFAEGPHRFSEQSDYLGRDRNFASASPFDVFSAGEADHLRPIPVYDPVFDRLEQFRDTLMGLWTDQTFHSSSTSPFQANQSREHLPIYRDLHRAPERNIQRLSRKRATNLKSARPTEAQMHETCTICLCEFEASSRVCELDCKHAFHKECLGPWARKDNSCPVCREPILK
mmetsp:Transcript_12175/g.23105  ORF Transcript_12175/g.23105 Transcript_12175/m.23105 type:complete len:259 (+) Transcript_12175:289-1065(+)